MAKHKTAHRKRLEAHNKEAAALRLSVAAELAEGRTLKPNAVANAKRLAKPSKK